MYWSWEVAFDVLPQLAKGVVVTIQATFVASILAYVLGLGIAILKMSKSKILRFVLYWTTEFIRRTPILVQLYVVFYVLPDFGIFFEAFTCGVLVLGIHFSTYTAEVFRAGIDNVHKGQWEAAKSIGMNKSQTYRYIILPQSIKFLLPPMTGEVVHMVKSSAIVSVIAVAELTTLGQNLISDTYMAFEIWFTIAIIYMVVILILSIGASLVEKRYTVLN